MPTVIDSLVLELGLDASKFTKQQREAIDSLRKFQNESERASKDIEAHQKRQGTFFAGLKAAASGLAAGWGVGQVVGFVNNIQRADAAVSRTAHTLNMSARNLEVWRVAMRDVGGDVNSASAAFQGLNQDIYDFLTNAGGGAFREVTDILRVPVRDAKNRVREMGDILLDIAAELERRFPDDPAQKAAFLRKVPGMNPDMINFLVRGRKAIDDSLAAAERAVQVNQEGAAAADEYTKKLGRLTTAYENLKRAFGATVAGPAIPAMETATDSLTMLNKHGWWKTFGDGVTSTVRGWARLFGLKQANPTPGPENAPAGIAAGPVGAGARVQAPIAPRLGLTRADRNNNPGNIEYGDFARRHGATGSDGRFAIFPDRETGFKAAEALMLGRGYRNLTLPQIGARWAEGDPNWAKNAAAATGLPMDRPLTDEERIRLARLGTVAAEGSRLGGRAGLQPATGGAAITNTTTIGSITVVVPNGDPNTIAGGIGNAIDRNRAQPANGGSF